jgi:hypothetical protein
MTVLVFQLLKSHPFSFGSQVLLWSETKFTKKRLAHGISVKKKSSGLRSLGADADPATRTGKNIPVHGLKVPRGGDHVWGGELVEFLLAGALAGHVAGARSRPVPGTKHTLSFTWASSSLHDVFFRLAEQFSGAGNRAKLCDLYR